MISTILSLTGVFTILDVYQDYLDGAPIVHIIPEVLVIVFSLGIALYLLQKLLANREALIDSAILEAQKVKQEAQAWQSKAQSLREGISEAISTQFDSWHLSKAEKDVGFLLLKGMSIQEISGIRETSERTVRQQASEIYRKSGLSGRAQLSAFFLEDLF